jgi:hypothetical protein
MEQQPNPPTDQTEVTLTLQDTNATLIYANFARVSATPEEVLIDLGVNANPFAPDKQSVEISTKAIFSLYTAKRLLSALQLTIQRHEQTFGSVELDVRNRVVGQSGGVEVSPDVPVVPLTGLPGHMLGR